jgi:hypothetical protein
MVIHDEEEEREEKKVAEMGTPYMSPKRKETSSGYELRVW